MPVVAGLGNNGMTTRWARIGLYYAVAIAVSALARLHWHMGADTSASAGSMYLHLFAGVGPALGVLAMLVIFRHRPSRTFAGSNAKFAIATIMVPAVVLALRGIANPFGMNSHLFGLHMGVWITAYAVLEEIGWRGYLQGEFADRSPLARYAIVGLFWYAWHLSWVTNPSIGGEGAGALILIAAAIGIGFVADRTQSILAAAAFHVIGNILGMTTDFRMLVPSGERLLLAGLCFGVLLAVLRLWRISDKVRPAQPVAQA